jgi:type I restriction enzyme S subunit
MVESDYLMTVFKSYYGSGFFARMAAGGAGIHHLSAGKFAAVAVPLPPMEEQAAIINSAEDALSVARAVQEAVSTNLRRTSSLRQSILKQAFDGKLVGQDPHDEPASVLLERIRAERERQAAGGKARARTGREGRTNRGSKTRGRRPGRSRNAVR